MAKAMAMEVSLEEGLWVAGERIIRNYHVEGKRLREALIEARGILQGHGFDVVWIDEALRIRPADNEQS